MIISKRAQSEEGEANAGLGKGSLIPNFALTGEGWGRAGCATYMVTRSACSKQLARGARRKRETEDGPKQTTRGARVHREGRRRVQVPRNFYAQCALRQRGPE